MREHLLYILFYFDVAAEHHQDKEGSGNESLIGGGIGSIIAAMAICVSIYILRRRYEHITTSIYYESNIYIFKTAYFAIKAGRYSS
jgi:hypothetical protein